MIQNMAHVFKEKCLWSFICKDSGDFKKQISSSRIREPFLVTALTERLTGESTTNYINIGDIFRKNLGYVTCEIAAFK
jgi:hypothetical protein